MITSLTKTTVRNMVRLHFTSNLSNPTFYIWIDGELVYSTKVNFFDVPIAKGTYVQVDVFDSDSDTPSPQLFTGGITVSWERTSGVVEYYLQHFESNAWKTIRVVRDLGQWRFTAKTGLLADCETHRLRVVAVGENKEQVIKEFSFYMVRNPDPTSLEFDLSVPGEVSIHA
jgi:hypothetical protein